MHMYIKREVYTNSVTTSLVTVTQYSIIMMFNVTQCVILAAVIACPVSRGMHARIDFLITTIEILSTIFQQNYVALAPICFTSFSVLFDIFIINI